MESSSQPESPDEYLEALKSCVPPSRRERPDDADAHAAPPAPDSDGQWREPTDVFTIKVAGYFNISMTCRACRGPGANEGLSSLVFCGGCGAPSKPAHLACLRRNPDHHPSSRGVHHQHCGEVGFKQYIFMKWLFDVSYLRKARALHLEDVKTTWFGVPHDQPETEHPQLYLWNRMRDLVSEVADAPQRQYPSLVSFVSPTGSGKSTLIRALIRMLEPVAHMDFAAPVPGSIDELFVSTSSDVHLYPDPRTRQNMAPLYFADCEGLSGNDDPVARRVISKALRVTTKEGRPDAGASGSGKPTAADRISHHLKTASHREILRWGHLTYPAPEHGHGDRGLRWAKFTGQVDSRTRRRIVSQLYPRLLYAFSDVVCFVQNNTRDGQDMFDTLFNWARQGHEKTLNQRVRPGLIIVLNKSAELVHDALGTPDQATRQMLNAYARSSKFRELQRTWEKRGKHVRSAEELIYCYYHAFQVVSIPTYSSSPAVAGQMASALRGLYQRIREMSERVRRERRSFNIDPDVSTFNLYVEYAASKLAKDYKAAVDFHYMQMSSGDSSLPTQFSEHLVQLMSSMAKLRGLDNTNDVGGEAQLVEDIIPFIGSCIVSQVSLSDHKERARQTRNLTDECRMGLEMFRDESWRCEAVDADTRQRCANFWEGHAKGHQFRSGAEQVGGDTLSVGEHESSYNGDKYMNRLWEEIYSLTSQVQEHGGAAKRNLAAAAQAAGVNRVQSQRTCIACLFNCPTNTLPCCGVQHSVCEPCIRRNMSRHESSWAHLSQCPLGCQLSTTPWKVRVKPATAGSRVLALDGGGVRGVVELKILSRIQEEVGFGIKIQDLFDLVIGTSTGGIVALGVFEKGWTLPEATWKFRDLATRAFQFRRALKIPLYSTLAVPFCAFKYKTAGIVEALQNSFGEEDFLFGQPRGDAQAADSSGSPACFAQDQVKVGVVACIDGRFQPCLIANYSRNPLPHGAGEDILQREDEQVGDFRTWQAARATSSAQTFFKPYTHAATRRSYVDGAVVRNNPVRVALDEALKIWPGCPPDVVVSLGTGIMVDAEGNHVPAATSGALADGLKSLVPARLLKKAETGLNMVESTLDCHREWLEFRHAHGHEQVLSRNLHRIDVGLEERPPKIDAVDEIGGLMDKSEKYLAPVCGFPSAAAEQLRSVARRLRASLFYFSVSLTELVGSGTMSGKIHCRLPAHSEGASSLLASGPIFRLREEVGPGHPHRFHDVHLLTGFDPATLSADAELQVCGGSIRRSIEVMIASRGLEWEPISGF